MNYSVNFINDDKFDLFKSNLPKAFIYFIILLWGALAYAPFDLYATEGNATFIQSLVDRLHFYKFSLYQVLAIGLLFFIYSFEKEQKAVRYASFFLFCSIMVFVINLFNPNNDLNIQEYLFSDNVFVFYFLIIFFYLVSHVKRDVYVVVFNTIGSIGLYVLLILCIQSDVLYFLGKGAEFFGGFPSTIPQMDVLIYISVFQLLMLIQYLKTMERKYLVYLAIFLVTLIFSYRRSALLVGLIADVVLFFYYFYVSPVKTKATRIIMISISVFTISLVSLNAIAPDKFDNFVYRYLGAFSYFSKSNKMADEFSDSGHMEQSIETTKIFFSRIGDTFWGAGFGNRPFYVEGQANDGADFLGGIHNSFVLGWAQWGLHATIFLVLLVLLMLAIIFKLLATKNQNLTIAGMIIYLLGYLVLGWTNGIMFLSNLQYTFLIVFLFSVIKFLPQDDERIPKSPHNK